MLIVSPRMMVKRPPRCGLGPADELAALLAGLEELLAAAELPPLLLLPLLPQAARIAALPIAPPVASSLLRFTTREDRAWDQKFSIFPPRRTTRRHECATKPETNRVA